METEFNYADSVVNLYDLALLLNYERASTETRFRHHKLREVALGNQKFETVRLLLPDWENATIPKVGYVFDRPKAVLSTEEQEEPDLPTNMLPNPVTTSLQSYDDRRKLETIYWQARNHDGCFTCITLLQHFFDLLQPFSRLRIQVIEQHDGKPKPRTFSTLVDDCRIVEFHTIGPKSANLSMVLPENVTYITGMEPSLHAVLGIPPPGGTLDTILDLSSLQFGDVGRGYKGKSLFVLEPTIQYVSRLSKFANENTFKDAKISHRINASPRDEWLKGIARRVKDRLDNQEEKWCGHCGAPSRRGKTLQKCSKCQAAWYCDQDHQSMAWPFHRHFCEPPRWRR